MTRIWLRLLTLISILAVHRVGYGQVDFDAIRSGAAGCPELAADAGVGNLAAFLCRPVDRTILDMPINLTGNKVWEVRAGSFHPYTRPGLLSAARPSLGEAEYARLLDLLLNGSVLSHSSEAYRLSLFAEGRDGDAASIVGTPETVFEANIPALLLTRIDRDRFADLRSGLFQSPGARDTVSHYEPALGGNLLALVGGLPSSNDADGNPVYTSDNAKVTANPFFVGPDGLRNTPDDLPYVANNDRARAAGYRLAAPISGTTADRFDATFGRNSATDRQRQIYSETAQINVPSAVDHEMLKLVELYGVYSPDYLISQGCPAVTGATYNRLMGQCTRGVEDVSTEAIQHGCGAITQAKRALSVGTNADGDCIELNTSSPGSGSELQFEVIALLGDPAARPLEAVLEPVDLTDLRAVADGGGYNTLPARPRASGTGNVSFPAPTSSIRRRVDLATGAPVAIASTACSIRRNGLGAAVGPNGVAGDGDDVFPSAGYCLLWELPDGGGQLHLLRAPEHIASTHSVNQSLFHTLCTLSFDSDEGFCALDRRNYPLDFGLTSNILSGLGVLGSVVLDGVESIQRTGVDGSTSVIARGTPAVLGQMLLAIEPLALQSFQYQDLGVSLRSGQAATLGCGPAYASACSSSQQQQWSGNPAIVAALTRDPALGPSKLGGVDLMNTDASVFEQEFTVVKHWKAGTLVGATANDSDHLVFLPGVNFSRTGQQGMNVDQAFTRQGQQVNVPPGAASIEAGAYLSLTPSEVVDLGVAGRAGYQTEVGSLREADGWVEPMPWTVNQEMLDRFGAIVFNADPNNVLDLDSPLNDWNLVEGNSSRAYSNIDGEYCARWMNSNPDAAATPFNLGCTALETVSANLERWNISLEIIGQDRVFDAPESLEELVAMLDGDPSNDATGDPIAGPDGIFARNQFVISDEQMDFEVVAAPPTDDSVFVSVALNGQESAKEAAARTLLEYDPQSCPSSWCYLDVTNVLTDQDDASGDGRALILAMPMGFTVNVMAPLVNAEDPNQAVDTEDPNQLFEVTFTTRKVNLAGLQYFDLTTLRRLLASRVVAIDTAFGTAYVQMSTVQRDQLFGQVGSQTERGRDMDGDHSSDLDRNRDAIWDGQDDYLPGPISDDSLLCGSGIPGDLLQDGVQFSPYRADQKPGQAAFAQPFPDGLPPRSPVFCREMNALLGLVGPLPSALPGESDAFLWHGGQGAPETDGDADGFPGVMDNCPTTANASQADGDTDGVGDFCDNCPAIANTSQPDGDRDGIGDICDNCPSEANADQTDADGDDTGDACEVIVPLMCDVDLDGNIDIDDVSRIVAARGTASAGPGDPRDSDLNGIITVYDGRLCVLRCDRARCQRL